MKKTIKTCLIVMTLVLSLSACGLKQKTQTYTFHGIAFDVPAEWDDIQKNGEYIDINLNNDEVITIFQVPYVTSLDYFADDKDVEDELRLDYGYDVDVQRGKNNGLEYIDATTQYLGSQKEDVIYAYRLYVVEGDGGIIAFEYFGKHVNPNENDKYNQITKSIRVA